ncbi:MAG TPA: hypothetical protein VG796_20855 [Verrucomicrobiales bacterium]|nr:hypothetical protein [Verrucomicrobiales bacterium]
MTSSHFARLAVSVAVLSLQTGCFVMRPGSGGGQTANRGPRNVRPGDIALLPGYRIEPVAAGLTFPTGVAFDASGRPFIVESGYCYVSVPPSMTNRCQDS